MTDYYFFLIKQYPEIGFKVRATGWLSVDHKCVKNLHNGEYRVSVQQMIGIPTMSTWTGKG